MLSDNVGYGDIGAFQGGAIRGAPTPNIDSIAAEGMTFTQFLVEPGCTPSRAGLLTGRYSPRGGVGKIVKIGKQAMNAQVQSFYKVEKPDNVPNWALWRQLQFISPIPETGD